MTNNNIPDSPEKLLAQQYTPIFERLFEHPVVQVQLYPMEILLILECVIVGLKTDKVPLVHETRIKQIAQAWSQYICHLEPEMRPLIERIWRTK